MKKLDPIVISTAFFLLVLAGKSLAQPYTLASPDQKTDITIDVGNDIKWSVTYDHELVMKPSRIAIELTSGKILGDRPSVKKTAASSVNKVIESPVPVKSRLIAEQYNELRISFKGNYSVIFRAYNDGVAYRFETNLAEKEISVKNEIADFDFAGDFRTAWPTDEPFAFGRNNQTGMDPGFGSLNPPSANMFGPPPSSGTGPNSRAKNPPGPPVMPKRSPFNTSYEYLFRDSTVAAVTDTVGLPLYLSTPKGVKVVLLEADLFDYPNLFVRGTGSSLLTATFPHFVIAEQVMGPMSRITQTADYIASTSGTRVYPWRAMAISPDDKGLLENELVYKLSSPPVIPTDWIQPGQVAWEWWHGSNLFDVDFKAGVNTASYQHYIDFAARYGIRYMLIDAGWSNNKNVDIPEIARYARERNVGVMLWMAWRELLPTLQVTLDQFQEWGIKGVKMDYMDRADQEMVAIFEKVAVETAKRKMLIDFHGAFKPTGLNRKYPNVINYEGVKGLEHDKLGSSRITPSHDVVLLFTRMVAGPMDYTPGALRNASYGNFRNIPNEPMSQGTRAHQAAMYIMYDAPVQMLADNPSLYVKEDPYTRFITGIPTVWDKTVGIDGKIGQYAILARKKGDNWYIGGMCDWTGRDFTVKLDFLDAKKYHVTIIEDGLNADHYGADYKIKTTEVSKDGQMKITMKAGGGWAAKLEPIE